MTVLSLPNLKIYRFRAVIITTWGRHHHHAKKPSLFSEERCSLRPDSLSHPVLVFLYPEVGLTTKCPTTNKENVANRELIPDFYWSCCKEKTCYRKENFPDFKSWEFCLSVYKSWSTKAILILIFIEISFESVLQFSESFNECPFFYWFV